MITTENSRKLTVIYAALGHLLMHMFAAFYFVIVLAIEDEWKFSYDEPLNLWFLGSVAGGGRYDKLISRFGKEDVPATGISVGVDRLIVALEQLDLIKAKSRPLVIVANLGDNNLSEYIRMASEIRDAGMACEISFGSKNLAKQLKYCDRKQADAVVIAGDDEIKNNKISLKDLKEGSEISKNITGREEWKETKAGQKEVIREDLVSTLKEILKI